MFYALQQPTIRLRHVAFCLSLVALFVGSLTMACLNTGPIILGTEMNDNGLVEYMCLGTGCEDFTAFRWDDKY